MTMARTKARTAYFLTTLSSLCLVVGWLIPFWFGRVYGTTGKRQWGLFYMLVCDIGRCYNDGGALGTRGSDPDAVDFAGGDNDVELLAIPVLATLSLACCLLGLIAVLVFHKHCCGKSYSYHRYVWLAAIVQFMTGAFVLSTVIVHAVALEAYFSTSSLESVIEFPWSLVMYCLGGILVTASAILYTVITCRWRKYRMIYARKRYLAGRLDRKKYPPGVDPPPDYNKFGGSSPKSRAKHERSSEERIKYIEPHPDYMHVEFKTVSSAPFAEGYFQDNRYNRYLPSDNHFKPVSKVNKSTNGNSRVRYTKTDDFRDIVTGVISEDKWHVPREDTRHLKHTSNLQVPPPADWRSGRDYGGKIYIGDRGYSTYLHEGISDDDVYTHVIRPPDIDNGKHQGKYDEIQLTPKAYKYYYGRHVCNGRRSYDDYDAMRISRHKYGPISGDWTRRDDDITSPRGREYVYNPQRGLSRSHTWYRT